MKKQKMAAVFAKMKNRNVVQEDVKMEAIKLAMKQIEMGESHGKAVEMFYTDGWPCIRYQDGQWWHYNIVKGVWF